MRKTLILNGEKHMAKRNRKPAKPDRLSVTLTAEESEKLNKYIIKTGERQGRIPSSIKTKIIRAAVDEWFRNHENDFDINWEKD